MWSSGEPAWIADVLADDNFPRVDAARRAGLSAAFCFPVRSARGVFGVMEFLTAEPRELDAELLATMANVGDQIGQALERRSDAVALRAKEARHRAMLDAALDCVVTMDHDGLIVDFNPAAERTFGRRAADVIGLEMADVIIPPDLRARHREGLQRYLDTESPTILDRRLELTAVRADGTVFPVELTITRIDVPGPPTFTGYLRDITDRKAAEAELRAAPARLVEAADAARRRIERDLHDGAQQRLVELSLDLRMLRSRLDEAPDEARELLATAIEDLTAAIGELRELAHGIHPTILTEGGLRPALERARVPLAPSTRSSWPRRTAASPRRWRRRRTSSRRRRSPTWRSTRARRTPTSRWSSRTAGSASRCATTGAAAPTRHAARGCAG